MRQGFGWLLCAGLFLSLAACGFHLRSYDFGTTVGSIAVTGKTNLRITDTLQRSLKEAGVEQVDSEDAALVLELLDQHRERRSISTAGSTRAAEYEMILAVQYRILDSAGMELSGPAWIERQRVYRIDKANIMGSSEEQALLERELVQDVVGQIIRAIDTVNRNRDINTVSAHAD